MPSRKEHQRHRRYGIPLDAERYQRGRRRLPERATVLASLRDVARQPAGVVRDGSLANVELRARSLGRGRVELQISPATQALAIAEEFFLGTYEQLPSVMATRACFRGRP